MKFRIVKTGWLSYDAQATENGYEWITLDNFCTERGAKRYCIYFAELCKREPSKSKENIVDEFEIPT